MSGRCNSRPVVRARLCVPGDARDRCGGSDEVLEGDDGRKAAAAENRDGRGERLQFVRQPDWAGDGTGR